MPADWTISFVEHRNSGSILGWNLESPQPGPVASASDKVRFRGWFLVHGGPGRVTVSHSGVVLADLAADLTRPDVARTHCENLADSPLMECCGFDLVVPRRIGPYRLEASGVGPDGGVMVFDILDRLGGPYALIGRDRQLFLGGDTNDSVGQFTESRTLPEGSALSWAANFAAMKGWEADLGLRMALLVAPAKEEILSEAFPIPRATRTVLDDFRIHFAAHGPIVPIHELRAQRQFTYSETDTHWTDQGASIAARAVLKHWDMDEAALAALPQEFRVRQRQGDLGVKLQPRRASYELAFAQNPDRFLVFDNGVNNNGCIRLWQNPDAALPGSCLIFGDSFGTNFAQSLVGVFGQVAYAYRPAAFCPVLADMLTPGHVILQITQRFLHGSPDRRETIFDIAAIKIKSLPEAERGAVTERLRAQADGAFAALATAHLARL